MKTLDLLTFFTNFKEHHRIDYYYDEDKNIMVSTAYTADCGYETAILHPEFSPYHIIVEYYDTVEQAKEGHAQWVIKMKEDTIPTLTDISTYRDEPVCFTRKSTLS